MFGLPNKTAAVGPGLKGSQHNGFCLRPWGPQHTTGIRVGSGRPVFGMPNTPVLGVIAAYRPAGAFASSVPR